MTLREPFFISSRLLPSVRVGDATVGIEYAAKPPRGRVTYRYVLDFADGTEYTAEDIQSGTQGGTLREGMESLLSFLCACGESSRPGYAGENADLFPLAVAEWCHQNSDEIWSAKVWIEESPECCVE